MIQGVGFESVMSVRWWLDITLLVLFFIARLIPSMKCEGINWQRDERFMVIVTEGELLASNGHKSMSIIAQLFRSTPPLIRGLNEPLSL